ncbi:MAG TPA: hypothetical protein VNO55_27895 [Polyangia bacterium]|nr:hypothetical protein [Polyangia bacterium]
MFGGQEVTAGGPRVVYPLDGAMHPANILDLAIQWQGLSPPQARIYRLRLKNARGMMDFYTSCSAVECIYQVLPKDWQAVGDANRDSDVSLTVAAAGDGATVPTSPAIQIHFTPTSVAGGLYYWSTAKSGIYRLTFGQSKAVPFIDDPASCHGCHSVSRNGKQIAWVDYGSMGPFRGPGMTSIRSAPTDAPPPTAATTRINGTGVALNPDGTRFVVTTGTSLALYDSITLAAVSTMTPGSLGTKSMMFLEWSPDGQNIALTVGTRLTTTQNGGFALADSDIAIVPFNNGQFGALRTLVAAGQDFHYYPTWSPDGKWIAFISASASDTTTLGPGTYDNNMGRLRLIAASGGTIHDLQRASLGLGTNTSWPKFAPFSQLGGDLLFVGFSSKGDYGFSLKNSTVAVGMRRAQLWFAAIDLRRLSSGDPSWAPLWLPFQEVDQSNHIPLWTEVIGCLSDADCGPGSVCSRPAANQPGQCHNTIVIP